MATYLSTDRPSHAEQISATSPQRRYRAEVSDDLLDPEGRLIDWLLGLALGTLEGSTWRSACSPHPPSGSL